MNYYPSLLLLNKFDPQAPFAWLVYMSPVVAVILSFIASRVWNLAIRRYSSSGG
jgi:ABC-2 type transport system permease protein